jgi:outer membrane immunogenic protein
MKLVSGILGLTLASAVAVVAANAADLYRPAEGVSYKDAPVDAPWVGPYVGINGGYAWGGNSNLTPPAVTPPPVITLQGGAGDPSFSAKGWFGGGQAGYNWQTGQIVYGVEADIQGADITGSVTAGGATATNNLNWFGTARGRIGYAAGAALVYGTGGFAVGGVHDTLTSGTTVAHDATATGYAVGGGLEYAFSPRWSGKAEYQYINLGKDDLTNNGATASFDHDYNTVRLGLNYHVHPGYEPLK